MATRHAHLNIIAPRQRSGVQSLVWQTNTKAGTVMTTATGGRQERDLLVTPHLAGHLDVLCGAVDAAGPDTATAATA